MKPWTRSDTLALANNRCTTCAGSGLRRSRQGGVTACNCVLRAIFRACFSRFIECARKSVPTSSPTLERGGSRGRRYVWSRKEEEYAADFCLISRRSLTALEYDVFRFHFLLGGDWRICCRRLNLDRGNFYHTVYRVEEKLGWVFRNVEPYALFPLDEYFGGATRLHLDDFRDTLQEDAVAASLSRTAEDDFFPEDAGLDLTPSARPARRVIPIRAPVAKPRLKSEEDLAA